MKEADVERLFRSTKLVPAPSRAKSSVVSAPVDPGRASGGALLVVAAVLFAVGILGYILWPTDQPGTNRVKGSGKDEALLTPAVQDPEIPKDPSPRPLPQDEPQKVERLVRDARSDDPKVREEALKHLHGLNKEELLQAVELLLKELRRPMADSEKPASMGLAKPGFFLTDKEVSRVFKEIPRLTFTFRDADVRDVVDMIARASRKNIIVSPEVKGKVTAQFNNKSWSVVLEAVVKKLGYEAIFQDHSTVRVGPPK